MLKKNKENSFIKFFLFFYFFIFTFVQAEEFSSSGFIVSEPVLAPSAYSNSSSFSLWSSVSEIGIGVSTSTSFGVYAGFLPFPLVSTPALSATPQDQSVSLSWSASETSNGWNVSGYQVGRALTSTGPYTFTSVGNSLTYTSTSLINNTTYYFIVRVLDGSNNPIATSSEVSATPVGTTPSGGGGGGGGGGSTASSGSNDSSVVLSGRAYPLSKVSILKDGQLVATTIAGPDSNFSVKVDNLSQGDYSFAVYSEDNKKIKSKPFTFPVFLSAGVTTTVGGIFIAPTISVDRAQVKKGDNIVIFGQSTENAEITISVHSPQEFFVKTASDKNGVYLINFDTSVLDIGNHTTKSKATKLQEVSFFSNTASFKVGTENVILPEEKGCSTRDLNTDCRVNLVDFSILAFWYQKSSPPTHIDLNNDGKVNLIDFSILAYHWTG